MTTAAVKKLSALWAILALFILLPTACILVAENEGRLNQSRSLDLCRQPGPRYVEADGVVILDCYQIDRVRMVGA